MSVQPICTPELQILMRKSVVNLCFVSNELRPPGPMFSVDRYAAWGDGRWAALSVLNELRPPGPMFLVDRYAPWSDWVDSSILNVLRSPGPMFFVDRYAAWGDGRWQPCVKCAQVSWTYVLINRYAAWSDWRWATLRCRTQRDVSVAAAESSELLYASCQQGKVITA